MIYVNASIGAGKSSLVKILSEDLGTPAFFEEVEGNEMLKKFYATGPESREALAFPLQISFLVGRFEQLRRGIQLAQELGVKNTVYDSSLLSDSIMARNLHKRGEFPDAEYHLYMRTVQQMVSSISANASAPIPDVVIYLKISPEKEIEQIATRGRDIEVLDEDRINYFKDVNGIYHNWAESYSQSRMITIDMDEVDFVNNPSDRIDVLNHIEDVLQQEGLLSEKDREEILKRRGDK